MPLYELPQATLQDAHKVLRAIADEIEKGEYGKIDNGILAQITDVTLSQIVGFIKDKDSKY
jgi:hypothetical protein